MITMYSLKKRCTAAIVLSILVTQLWGQPISLHPENPHCFQYAGKAQVLIGSGEHYGALTNPDFDFSLYLQTTAQEGFNHTRLFMGDYGEAPDSFCIVNNTLEAAPGKFLAPWARSDEPGFSLGGNKFDLQHWNPAYFDRLHAFMQQAEAHGIVVECVLFFVGMSWEHMPLNRNNNINHTSDIEASDYMTLANGNILNFQKQYCLKLVNELNRYDNIIFNIANEPWFFNQEHDGFSSPARDETKAWIKQVSNWITEAEEKLPKKHLISVDYSNEGCLIPQEEIDAYWSNISILNHHYDREAESVKLNYRHVSKAFAFNETGLMPVYTSQYRIQGWKYLMSGGALYNNLDFTFQVGHEDGTGKGDFSCDGYNGCGDIRVRKELQVLVSFFNSIDFAHMRPSPEILTVYYGDKDLYVLADPGKQYALYVVGGVNSYYRLAVPPARYRVEWIDPVTGITIINQTVNHTSGDLRLDGPAYDEDLALRLTRI